jgi:predicted ATPase
VLVVHKSCSSVKCLGTDTLELDPTLQPQRALAATLRLAWTRRARRGFFLRAEDYLGHLRYLSRNDARVIRERAEGSRIRMAPLEQPSAIASRHVDEVASDAELCKLDARSHGESFFELFQTRIEPGGLYLLDEPEAPLSARRQIDLVNLLAASSAQGAQFVIATHSPILLATPRAAYFAFGNEGIAPIAYEAIDNVRLTKAFLHNPSQFMQH